MSNLLKIFGTGTSTAKIQQLILSLSLSKDAERPAVQPQIKAYPGAIYHNYPSLGLSLEYSRNVASNEELCLDAIHLYNKHEKHDGSTDSFCSYPALPLTFSLAGEADVLEITAETTAQNFVAALGEPTRKGGGQGPSSGSINIWCEWTTIGIMAEFGGPEARGPEAWDKGRDAIWKELTLFQPHS